jgi:hypothetical protein
VIDKESSGFDREMDMGCRAELEGAAAASGRRSGSGRIAVLDVGSAAPRHRR